MRKRRTKKVNIKKTNYKKSQCAPKKKGDYLDFSCYTPEVLFKMIGKSPPFSRTAAKWMSQDVNVYSCRKALKVMGYKPKINLKEGIKRSIKWYRKKGFLK